METKKIVQISFVILLVMTFVALIYGVFAAVSPESFLSRSFPLYTGQPWNDFLTQSPTLANYMIILEREAGGLGIALSLGGVIVLLTAFRKVEKWAWYYILVVSIIGWVNLLIANIIFKNSLIIVIIGIGLLLVVVGLIMSARVFLTNKKE
jgi:hypothetical protein